MLPVTVSSLKAELLLKIRKTETTIMVHFLTNFGFENVKLESVKIKKAYKI